MEANKIWFDETFIHLETKDKKIAKMPLEWFPRLLNATKKQKSDFELWNNNRWIHWEEIGEDLSVEGFFTYKGKHSIKKQ